MLHIFLRWANVSYSSAGYTNFNTVLEGIYSAQSRYIQQQLLLKVRQEGIYVESIKDIVMNATVRRVEGCCYSTT